jgi:hypothetical protein
VRVLTEAEWAEVDAQKRRWLSGEDTRSLAEFKASLAGGIVARTPVANVPRRTPPGSRPRGRRVAGRARARSPARPPDDEPDLEVVPPDRFWRDVSRGSTRSAGATRGASPTARAHQRAPNEAFQPGTDANLDAAHEIVSWFYALPIVRGEVTAVRATAAAALQAELERQRRLPSVDDLVALLRRTEPPSTPRRLHNPGEEDA